MKYVLLFCGTREQQQAWENMSEEARNAQYAQVGRWFAENAAKLGPGNPVVTALLSRWRSLSCVWQ